MADETRRIPMFLSGPTTPLAVLLPVRLYVGWFWLKLGLDKLHEGWLWSDRTFIVEHLDRIRTSNFIAEAFFSAARDNLVLSQWLVVGAQLLFGALVLIGGVTRVSAGAVALLSILWWVCAGYPWASWPLPIALMALTLAVAGAGRYLGLDAILKARMVKVPLF
jgi:uncharacterized membrane protein YphA (DoxX/SURF4 family)